MKKSILIASVIIIFVLIGGGAVWYVKTKKINQPIVERPNQNGQQASFYADIETKDWQVCKNEILGIQLKFPSAWGVCITDATSFSIKTDYKPYDVYLVANVDKNIKEDIDNYIVNSEGGNYIKIKDGEIFDSFCAPAIACNGAILNSDLYFFTWDIKSNQSAPLGYDGIWSPDHNVTEEDTWKILSTIEESNSQSDMFVCEHKKLGLRLKFPKGYKECLTDKEIILNVFKNNDIDLKHNADIIDFNLNKAGNLMVVKTDYQPYNVYLIIDISSSMVDDIAKYISQTKEKDDPIINKVRDGYIFDYSGYSGSRYNRALLDKNLYYFVWRKVSNQREPEGYDGIWSPDNDVTKEDLWKILSTIEKVE